MQDTPWTVDGFQLPYHQFLFKLLNGLSSTLWNNGVFVGGTLCVFRLGEYRKSDDLDFFFKSLRGLSDFRNLGSSIFGFGKCLEYTYYDNLKKIICRIDNPFDNKKAIKCEFLYSDDLLNNPMLFHTQKQNGKFEIASYKTSILMKTMAFCGRGSLPNIARQSNKDIVDLAVLFGKVGQEHFIEAFESLNKIWNDSWTRNRLRNKLSESTLLNSLDHHWLLPAERRLAERAGVEFLKFVAEYFDVPYTPLERTIRGIEDRECEAYLDYIDGKIVHGDTALARGWLPFVARDPVAEETQNYTVQDVREYSEDDMDEPCPGR